MSRRRRHIEVAASGIDEALQLVGGDPWNGMSAPGLRVPTAPTPTLDRRYMFKLASFNLADGANARLLGFRHGWTLGLKQAKGVGGAGTPRFIEQLVTSPNFKLPDGNVAWGLRVLRSGSISTSPFSAAGPLATPLRDVVFRMGDGVSGLTYERYDAPPVTPFYVDALGYHPPNKGRFYGTPLLNNLGVFGDLKTEWKSHGAWHSLDVPLTGPCTVAFMASVRQSNSETRPAITPPGTFFTNGLIPEEQFLLNFPTAIIWRVYGSLIFALDE